MGPRLGLERELSAKPDFPGKSRIGAGAQSGATRPGSRLGTKWELVALNRLQESVACVTIPADHGSIIHEGGKLVWSYRGRTSTHSHSCDKAVASPELPVEDVSALRHLGWEAVS